MSVYCNDCGMCCKLIPINDGEGIVVRDGFQLADDEFMSGLTELSDVEAEAVSMSYVEKVKNIFPDVKFFKCNHLNADNKCSLSEKPPICANFPTTPLAIVPDECICLGDVFMKNEQLKRKIRMIKEEILDYESLIESGDKDSASYKKIIENLTRFVTKYKDFGSLYW